MDNLFGALLTGMGATALIDGWAFARKRCFQIAAPDYGLVGRWIGTMGQGRFRHESIKASQPLQHELLIGWSAHYVTGVGFAYALLLVQPDWLQHPALRPALLVGFATVMLPFLLMQPGMGAGIASSRTSRPAAARLQSLITHGLFGVGLYLSGSVVSFLFVPGG